MTVSRSSVAFNVKKELCDRVVELTLLFVTETWIIWPYEQPKLDIMDMKCLGIFFGVTRSNRTTQL